MIDKIDFKRTKYFKKDTDQLKKRKKHKLIQLK